MNGHRRPNNREKPTWMLLVGLVACGVLIFKPQIVGTPLTAFSGWFGQKAAEHIQEDMEEQGLLPTTSTTTP